MGQNQWITPHIKFRNIFEKFIKKIFNIFNIFLYLLIQINRYFN
jgi:hypothetical protein